MKCRHGKLRRTVSAFTNLKTMSRAMCNMDGSTKHHELSTSIRERNLTIKLVRLSRLCCAGMALSSVHLLRRLRLPVDVAVLWIPLATAQRVPEQGCWADGVRGRECSRQCLPRSWRSRDREHGGETWVWGLPHAHDSRRLESVTANCIPPLFGGMHLAMVTTLISTPL